MVWVTVVGILAVAGCALPGRWGWASSVIVLADFVAYLHLHGWSILGIIGQIVIFTICYGAIKFYARRVRS